MMASDKVFFNEDRDIREGVLWMVNDTVELCESLTAAKSNACRQIKNHCNNVDALADLGRIKIVPLINAKAVSNIKKFTNLMNTSDVPIVFVPPRQRSDLEQDKMDCMLVGAINVGILHREDAIFCYYKLCSYAIVDMQLINLYVRAHDSAMGECAILGKDLYAKLPDAVYAWQKIKETQHKEILDNKLTTLASAKATTTAPHVISDGEQCEQTTICDDNDHDIDCPDLYVEYDRDMINALWIDNDRPSNVQSQDQEICNVDDLDTENYMLDIDPKEMKALNSIVTRQIKLHGQQDQLVDLLFKRESLLLMNHMYPPTPRKLHWLFVKHLDDPIDRKEVLEPCLNAICSAMRSIVQNDGLLTPKAEKIAHLIGSKLKTSMASIATIHLLLVMFFAHLIMTKAVDHNTQMAFMDAYSVLFFSTTAASLGVSQDRWEYKLCAMRVMGISLESCNKIFAEPKDTPPRKKTASCNKKSRDTTERIIRQLRRRVSNCAIHLNTIASENNRNLASLDAMVPCSLYINLFQALLVDK